MTFLQPGRLALCWLVASSLLGCHQPEPSLAPDQAVAAPPVQASPEPQRALLRAGLRARDPFAEAWTYQRSLELELRLEGLSFPSPEGPALALISGQAFAEGDRCDAFLVTRISSAAVVLRGPGESLLELSLSPARRAP